jgi:hypothetical protein
MHDLIDGLSLEEAALIFRNGMPPQYPARQ